MQTAPLQRAHLPTAVGALVRAFDDDAVYRSLWPDAARRARALRAFMTVPVLDAYDHGHVTVVLDGDQVLAVAAWVPPGAFPYSVRRKARIAPHMARAALADPRAARRLWTFGSRIEAAFPEDRPAYLAVVGVVPERQGKGVGSAVLGPGLGMCDAIGADAYLETETPRAVRLYERLGFVVLSSGEQLLPGGPTHWRMRRPAA